MKYASPLIQYVIVGSASNVIREALFIPLISSENMSSILFSTSCSLPTESLDLLAQCEHIDICNSVLREFAEAGFASSYGKRSES